MPIHLERAFAVRRPVGEVWGFLTDPDAIARCLPGARLLEIVDGRLSGNVDLRLGPFGTTLTGTAHFRELDPGRHTVRIHADAREVGGSGSAEIRMRGRLASEGDDLTRVDVRLVVRLGGRLGGPLVRRLLGAAAEIVFRRFASCAQECLESG